MRGTTRVRRYIRGGIACSDEASADKSSGTVHESHGPLCAAVCIRSMRRAVRRSKSIYRFEEPSTTLRPVSVRKCIHALPTPSLRLQPLSLRLHRNQLLPITRDIPHVDAAALFPKLHTPICHVPPRPELPRFKLPGPILLLQLQQRANAKFGKHLQLTAQQDSRPKHTPPNTAHRNATRLLTSPNLPMARLPQLAAMQSPMPQQGGVAGTHPEHPHCTTIKIPRLHLSVVGM